MKFQYYLMLIFLALTCSAFAQLGLLRLGYVYQNGGINQDGTVPAPNIPEIPWDKYTHLCQANIFPDCPTSSSTPAVDSVRLDQVVSSWGNKTFSTRFTHDAHAAGKPALVSLIGTADPDWPNACRDTATTNAFVDALLDYVLDNGYDGIDIDPERQTPTTEQLLYFMQRLYYVFKSNKSKWSGQPLIVILTQGYVGRVFQYDAYQYADHLLSMTYCYQVGKYNWDYSWDHPWYYSSVRKYPEWSYGGSDNYRTMDESIWYETTEPTPYSCFSVGVPFYATPLQCPLASDDTLGAAELTDTYDKYVSGKPLIAPEKSFSNLVTNSAYGWSTDSSYNTHHWDDKAKASYISRDTGELGTYISDDPYLGTLYQRTDGTMGDAFISYPSPRFIQETVKWAREEKAAHHGRPGGYLGGLFVWTVLADYLPLQSGDAQHPLSTALAEAHELNAWTYSAPAWDDDVTCWSQTDNTVSIYYDSSKQHKVTCISPPAGGWDQDIHILSEPGGSYLLNETTRCRYLRFAVKSSGTMFFVKVHASNGNDYILEYAQGASNPVYYSGTGEIIYRIPDMNNGSWHTIERDLQTDLNAFVRNVTITQLTGIKLRPYNTTYIDDLTVFEDSPLPPVDDNPYLNLAYQKPATQSSTHLTATANLAVDGDTDGAYGDGSVTHTAIGQTNSWWEVDLEGVFNIDEVVIWNRTDSCMDRLSNYHVYILDESRNTVWSNYQSSYPNPSVTLTPGGEYGRYVRISDPDILSLAEVQVYPKLNNVAEDKTATQSSTHLTATADLAVDGDIDGVYGDGSVTHTAIGQTDSWWKVDLGGNYNIGQIKIWNRTDTAMDRLSDYYVHILDGNNEVVWYSFQVDYPDPSTTLVPGGVTGRYVKVFGPDILSLAEVQVIEY